MTQLIAFLSVAFLCGVAVLITASIMEDQQKQAIKERSDFYEKEQFEVWKKIQELQTSKAQGWTF
tara:strand:+ start:2035 stop:2229 length:195 start_codon:yes stop_codon:yes gene_type:complete